MKNLFRKSNLAVNYNVEDSKNVAAVLRELGYEDKGYVEINADSRRAEIVVWPRRPWKRLNVHELQDRFAKETLMYDVNVSIC